MNLSDGELMLKRRSLLKSTAAGTALGLLSCAGITAGARAIAAHGGGITRAVPQTGEQLPAIGLGTFMTFDSLPGTRREQLQEVLRRFLAAGGLVIDTSPLYGSAEVSVGDLLSALGKSDLPFIANKLWSTGEFLWDESHAARSLQQSRLRLWRDRIDLMQCHSLVNADVVIPLLNAWKREGRIRYVGVTHHDPAYFTPLAARIEAGDVDFVQVHYSIQMLAAEERVLPAAADHGVAVFVNMPLEKGRLHKLVQGQALPDFAHELGINTWSQYFLKWVLAHPAVTAVLPSTSQPDHLLDNMAARQGELPDAALRKRMRSHLQSMPGFDALQNMPWYPDKTYQGLVTQGQQAVRARL
jgi:diketogulonate reductase-like aldo/keto reductase